MLNNSLDNKEYIKSLLSNIDSEPNPFSLDKVYNTPRAWFMHKYLSPKKFKWEGPDAVYTPESEDIPWSLQPDHKITIEDIKYLMSSYYQGTKFNPYGKHGDLSEAGKYRPIGANLKNAQK